MDINTTYEISRVVEFINHHNFNRVALQFPDEMLKDSMRVVTALSFELNSLVKIYVMADTTYGSCCVDEVGAAHVNAQCVIHYGHTCLSRTSTIPALFIFGKAPINSSNCVTNLLNCGQKSDKPVLVLFGLEYAHAIREIKESLASNASNLKESGVVFEVICADVGSSTICPSETCKPTYQIESIANQVVDELLAQEASQYRLGGLSWRLPQGRKMGDYLIFWIGMDNPAFENSVLTFNDCEVVRYDPKEDSLKIDLCPQKKILRRRYYLVEKTKDANMIGILVGTLGAVGYLHMIHQMRDLISKAGKKSYTFVMGRPNPQKLANFPECDVFIHISCAETALLDSKEFLAPIITPFEAILALDRGSQWTGEYVTEFRDLIAKSPKGNKQSEEARFSFFHGGYVEDLDLQESDEEMEKDEILSLVNTTERALQVKDDGLLLSKSSAKSGAEYFASRSYHGLDISVSNEHLTGKYLTGRSGKASGYKSEKTKGETF